jgi:hypothetical protein
MGRSCSVKGPLAETTLENMVVIMPGATIGQVGGTAATGTVTVATNPSNNDTMVVNGKTITFKTAAAAADEVTIGANAGVTAGYLAAALNASTDDAVAAATYSAAGSVVTVKYGQRVVYGTAGKQSAEGNDFTLGAGTAGAKLTLSGATLTGGVDATTVNVTVTSGIGTDLLSVARELRLHPVGKAASDKSQDFVMPLAATAGGLTFAYKLEEERIFNCEFMAYPNSATGELFNIGK